MTVLHWVRENGFDLLQAIGIIGGLFFAGASFWLDDKSRRISNLLTITSNHRQIWSELYERPHLARVLKHDVNVTESPLTLPEDLFIRSLILHLSTAYHATKDDVLLPFEGLERDIQEFFSLPLPKIVWESMKPFQDLDFVKFVEKSLQKKST